VVADSGLLGETVPVVDRAREDDFCKSGRSQCLQALTLTQRPPHRLSSSSSRQRYVGLRLLYLRSYGALACKISSLQEQAVIVLDFSPNTQIDMKRENAV
jgi:hypothetical protein